MLYSDRFFCNHIISRDIGTYVSIWVFSYGWEQLGGTFAMS